MSEKIQISNAAKNTRMAFKDQINQNVGFFIYNREFLFFSGIIGSPQAFNRFQIIPARDLHILWICPASILALQLHGIPTQDFLLNFALIGKFSRPKSIIGLSIK